MVRSSGKPHRSWPQRLVISLNAVVIIGALIGAIGLGYFNTKLASVQRLALSSVLTQPDAKPGAPQNFLIVGTDSDLGLSSNDPALAGRGDVTGSRSDTIMILRIDPKQQKASLLSLPRDLWVKIAGEGIHQKINAALGLGGEGTAGPAKLIDTIQENYGIPINHYVEIDFAGFEKLIGDIGGIPVYFNTGVRDRDENGIEHTAINIPGPGCYTLDPSQALAYARSRHIEIQRTPGNNSSWISDPSADFGRISRQQDFVKRVLKRAVAKGVRDPLIMNDLVDSGIKSVRVDSGLTAGDIINLGTNFRSFDPNNLQTIQLPAYATMLGAASVVLPRMPAAQAVIDEFRGDSSALSAVPDLVDVQVLDGSGRTAASGGAARALGQAGFQIESGGERSGIIGSDSIIRYQHGQESQAKLLARYLDSPVTFELVSSSTNGGSSTSDTANGPALVLVTGTGFNGVRAHPAPAAATPGPTTTTTVPPPSTTGGSSGRGVGSTSSTSTTSTTSTTVPGYVPGPPPPGVACG